MDYMTLFPEDIEYCIYSGQESGKKWKPDVTPEDLT